MKPSDEEAVPLRRPRIWLAVALLILPPIIIWAFETELVAAVAAIAWMLVSLPIAILTAVDWFRYPVRRTGVGGVIHAGLRVPLLIGGVTALVIAVVVLVWIAYNVFWARQPEFPAPSPLRVLAGVVMYLMMIAFGWKMIRLSVTRQAPPDRHVQNPNTSIDRRE